MYEVTFFGVLGTLAAGIPTTILLTFASLGLGIVLGLPVALLRRSRFWVLRFVSGAFVEVVRGVPPLAWLFIIFFGLPRSGLVAFDPTTSGILAFGLISSAYMAEIYRAGISAVPAGQWDACASLGLPASATYGKIIGPQALTMVIPPAATFAVGLLKDSALASVIGAGDITFRALILTQRTYEGFFILSIAALVYLAISIPMAIVSRRLDTRLRAHLLVRSEA
jgi:polar amino acid transport system permease protein